MSEEIELTRVERLMLANQYLILAKISAIGAKDEALAAEFAKIDPATDVPGAADYYAEKATILFKGIEFYYDQALSGAHQSTISMEVADEVFSIINMFDDLEFFINRLSEQDKAGLNLQKLEWQGLDATTSSDHYYFLQYLAEHHSNDGFEDRFFNSHERVLDKYRRLLEKYRSFERGLSVEKLRELIAVAY